MFQANPVGFVALVALAMCFSLAAVLYRVSTTGSVGRMLSLLDAEHPEYAGIRCVPQAAGLRGGALTEALPDGNISDRERELLNRLRDSLGISAADADAIEAELQEGLPSLA